MSEVPDPSAGAHRQLRHPDLARDFQGKVQKSIDWLAFQLAAHASASEDDYEVHARQVRNDARLDRHLPFPTAREVAREILSRQTITDAFQLSLAALHQNHLFLCLYKINREANAPRLEVQRQAQERQQQFQKVALRRKFQILREEYGIECLLDASIHGLSILAESLVKQQTVATPEILNRQGLFSLSFYTSLEEARAGEVAGTLLLQQGDSLIFSGEILLQALATAGVFAEDLFARTASLLGEQPHG